MAKLTLTYTKQPDQPRHAYKFAASAVGDGITSKVFVWHDGAGVRDDDFIGIASLVDIEDYPEDAAAVEDGLPYYRTAAVELWFRSAAELDEVQAVMARQLQQLVSDANAAADGAEEVVVYE